MWHYLLPAAAAIPCFAVWTYIGSRQDFSGIKPVALYGLAYLGTDSISWVPQSLILAGNLVSIAQPAALAYRSSTLYGASEQAVGGATAVAALSIASIIGPQVMCPIMIRPQTDSIQIFPIPDKPWYLPGFSASCATLACTLIGYASLPLCLLWEARRRKQKYGHAMPLRAMEDAQHAKVSEAARAQEIEQAMMEQKGTGDVEGARHVEQAREMTSSGG